MLRLLLQTPEPEFVWDEDMRPNYWTETEDFLKKAESVTRLGAHVLPEDLDPHVLPGDLDQCCIED